MPDVAKRIIAKTLHRLYMDDICHYINHNLVWIRGYDKEKKEFFYSFIMGEEKSNRFWALQEDAPCSCVMLRKLPPI